MMFEALERRLLLAVDLAVQVADQLVTQGEFVSYEVRVENLGDEVANDVHVADSISGLVEDVAWSVPGLPSSVEVSELTGVDGFEISGGLGLGNSLGVSLDHAGDVNGDGIDDIVVGNQIAVYVIFGSETQFDNPFDLRSLNGANGFVIVTETSLEFAHGAGDINTDGFDDLVIGDFVLFGRSRFDAVIKFDELDGNDGFQVLGGTSLGAQVVVANGGNAAGDVNGDGIDDLVFGGLAHPEQLSFVLFGSTSGFEPTVTLSDLDGTDGFRFGGGGASFVSAGDINGDGLSDVLFQQNESNVELYVLFGSSDAFDEFVSEFDVNGENGFAMTNAEEVERAEIVGDINGDGFDDIVLHGVENYFILLGTADRHDVEIDLALLDAGQGFFIDFVEKDTSLFGRVDASGDVNGDGIDDIVIGRPLDPDPASDVPPGRAYVLYGRRASFGARVDMSELAESTGLVIENEGLFRWNMNFGFPSNGSDLNNDGIDDILIGAPAATDPGFVSVIYGQVPLSGVGSINGTIGIGPGETVIYTVTGTVKADGTGSSAGTVTVTVGEGQIDPDTSNNVATYTLTVGEQLPGDIDMDGIVAFSDFLILAANFGKIDGVALSDGDIDANGTVDFADFLVLSNNFGRSVGSEDQR